MAAKTLRRRLHHGDVGGGTKEHFNASGYDDGLNQPLLGNQENDDMPATASTLEHIWDIEERRERIHSTVVLSQLIAQWAQWIANIVLGTGSVIGRFLPLPFAGQSGSNRKIVQPYLNPLQEKRLRNLQQKLAVPFDSTRLEHQDALKQLWRLAFRGRAFPSLKSDLWKDMGWQGSDPSTDFRGGGFISLENLIYFANTYPESFQRLLHKTDGTRAEWEYPFAVAGVNISFMLAQMLDLQNVTGAEKWCKIYRVACNRAMQILLAGKPSTPAGIRFLELLTEDELAFDDLYCVAFQMMDAQWLAKRASYMQFNDVLKSTRTQLEREFALEDICCVKDLPAYNLLRG